MRVSRLMLNTLRDVPSEAEIISHQLLIRAGFIKRITSGIYAYMPLLWKVLEKITRIVKEEMNNKDALQTLLPQLHPADLWKESGRWQGYTAGEGIMFNLKDRQNRELGLGPTHEEVITKIASETLNSYKQLPVTLYQIQTKFRDEIRPRFGLMRSREFIMKDAYSFHKDEKDLKLKYKEMDSAYRNIFKRCGLKTVAVEADSGAIGGSASQEFMVTADAGEDYILISSDGMYAANQEKAISKYSEPIELNIKATKTIETPNQNSINELCLKQQLDPSQVVKVILMIGILENNIKQPLLISIRGDQELNEVKLINFLTTELNQTVLEVSPITKEELSKEGLKPFAFGSIGPDLSDSVLRGSSTWKQNFLRVVDFSAAELSNFVCGSNQINLHKVGVSWDSVGGLAKKIDLRKAQAGDRCVHDETQILKECRGIEVGHIFQLGCKYSKKLKATFTNEKGNEEPFWMGCYGIGISRLAQAAIEQNNDNSGIIWPIEISPFEVIITVANMEDESQRNLGEKLYEDLKIQNIDVLIDDRNERAGIKFKDADLIGIPLRIVVGRDSVSGKVELFQRSTKETMLIDKEQAIKEIIKKINSKRS
tara:strand:- start:1937 stop:3727 length:1791 start_codon:yes stop_codon:yes gene_type:complete